jgi:hypothetical protein
MESQVYKISAVNKFAFVFLSTGKKDLIKLVLFDEIEDHVYNVALSTVLENGSVSYDDKINNGDTVKVLATVVECIRFFAESHPDETIFFMGDTPQKNRIYHEILSRHYDEFITEFSIFGVTINEQRTDVEKFKREKNFSGFYLRKKK